MKAFVVALMLCLPVAAEARDFVLPPLPQIAEEPKPAERVICRSEVATGSLVRRIRRCGNAEMWKRSTEAAQKLATDISENKGRYNFGDGQTFDYATQLRNLTGRGGQ